ncbi:MAG: hypothetical protein AB7G48_00995 [Nitrospiraceae bacterium]
MTNPKTLGGNLPAMIVRASFGFEDLHGVRLELIVPGKAFVEAHHAFGLLVRHGADQFQSQFALQTDQHRTIGDAVHGL